MSLASTIGREQGNGWENKRIKGPVPVAQNSGCVEWQHSRGQHATSNRKDKGYCTSSHTGDRAVLAGSSQVCFPDSSEERLLARRKHLQSRVTGGRNFSERKPGKNTTLLP